MNDKDLPVAALTRKEAKLIRLLRIQDEKCQQEIYEKVEKIYNEHMEFMRISASDKNNT